jgi:hypothetical protein
MNSSEFQAPPSPNTEALLALFTTLADEASPQHGSDNISSQVAVSEPDITPNHHNGTAGKQSLPKPKGQKRSASKKGRKRQLPNYMCFSSITGELVAPTNRSAFTKERREEVKQLRVRGACLRCQIRKIPVSSLCVLF